jgi:predicted dienelactone hydrolase
VQRLILGALLAACAANATEASPVGERHLTTTEDSAALRDAKNSDQLRVTVWHPAPAGVIEEPLDIGPPNKPLFRPGKVAPGAAFADDKPRPVILLSHGFGGAARMMAWFGTALAREGYVVIAFDHPRNNGMDLMTLGGATCIRNDRAI